MPGWAKRRTSLLLVEDDEQFAFSIVRVLADCEIEVVGTVAAAQAAIERTAHDAWIFDFRLPDGDGVDLLRWARQRGKLQHALIVTGVDPDKAIAAAAQLLGAEFLPKAFARATNYRAFLWRADVRTPLARQTGLVADEGELSQQQRRVLVALVGGQLRAELAAEMRITEATLETHVERLLAKLGVASIEDVRDRVLLMIRAERVREERKASRGSGVQRAVGSDAGADVAKRVRRR
jgi:DNA-binding NarL/FixJ family response regulator